MKAKVINSIALAAAIFMFFFTMKISAQQQLSFPRVSPHASVSQTIGFSTITVDYHRPAVNGRVIWGKLVPYGMRTFAFGSGNPAPWRAGANENTLITISDDCTVEGKLLHAGTYGLHILVEKDAWTYIFSNQTAAWGSFFYDSSEDELRVKVKPIEAHYQERMVYEFNDISQNSTTMYLHWEKLKAGIKFEFDVQGIVLSNFREQLTGLAGFNNLAWGQAANYCLRNKINLDEAIEWIDHALAMNGGTNFNNLRTKAGLLVLSGDNEKAEEINKQSFEIASESELNAFAYQTMNTGQIDKALELFKMNADRHPKSWNVFDSLAEALAQKGDTTGAEKNYKKALEMAPANQKARIKDILSKF